MTNVAMVLILPIRAFLPTGSVDGLEVVEGSERIPLSEVLEFLVLLVSQALILAWAILLLGEGSKGREGLAEEGMVFLMIPVTIRSRLDLTLMSRVLGAAYCWDTRGIVLGLWRAKGGESGMIGGEGG